MNRTPARLLWLLALGTALAFALHRSPAVGPAPLPAVKEPAVPALPALPRPATPAAPGTGTSIDPLQKALEAGSPEEARREAAALRLLLREDPEAWKRISALLLAKETPSALRQALALVIGTLDRPATDPLLLEALRLYGGDAAFARCALLALGATREPEDDDDVFGLGDRPWGAAGPGGLGITVRRRIEDAGTRGVLAEALGRPDAALREAAATSLRHSLDAPDARTAFLATLSREASDDVAPVLGEALAMRAGATQDGAERGAIVATLLARAGDEGLDAFRFRMENDFHRIPLGAAERAALADLASDGHPFGTRIFALTALANAAAREDAAGLEETRALLGRLVARDPAAAVRDASARLLGRMVLGEAEVAILVKAAREDAAWNVRFTALETLAARAPKETAVAALRAGKSDPEPRVAARAAGLLKKLAPGGD